MPQTMMIDTSDRGRLDSAVSDFVEEVKETRAFKLEEDFLFGLVTGSDL